MSSVCLAYEEDGGNVQTFHACTKMYFDLCVQQRMPAYTSMLLTYSTYTKPTPNLCQRIPACW